MEKSIMSRAVEEEEEDDDDQSLLSILLDTILLPIHALISLPARRFYLRTFLLTLTIPILAFISITAYITFHASYVPDISFSRPIHLQFHSEGAHAPYGVASLSAPASSNLLGSATSPLVSRQAYDISLHLRLPRSPPNLDAGNFMLTLDLLGPGNGSTDSLSPTEDSITYPVLATSSRPALLTYRSPLVRRAGTVLGLVGYTMGWSREEESVDVAMMQGWSAERGWRGLPGSVRVEVVGRGRLEVYEAVVRFQARFGGLRYLMHNHRVTSFVVFTTTFFLIELLTTLSVYALFTYFFGSATLPRPRTTTSPARVKSEEDETTSFSDTSRTFPTNSRQPPLKYTSTGTKVERGGPDDRQRDAVIKTEDADDEDEDADFVLDPSMSPIATLGAQGAGGRSDSGLGTSLESGNAGSGVAGVGSMRRRTSGSKRLS
ncbi:MAG: hypothetical protein M1828_003310 [Chrysothrix sp. TS-e1954]|nr:MAG: hypothetical protein M1828_003310 [Chrysothrix sp. TS-e1954]